MIKNVFLFPLGHHRFAKNNYRIIKLPKNKLSVLTDPSLSSINFTLHTIPHIGKWNIWHDQLLKNEEMALKVLGSSKKSIKHRLTKVFQQEGEETWNTKENVLF